MTCSPHSLRPLPLFWLPSLLMLGVLVWGALVLWYHAPLSVRWLLLGGWIGSGLVALIAPAPCRRPGRFLFALLALARSEERRVGKEGRAGGAPHDEREKGGRQRRRGYSHVWMEHARR